MRFKYDFGLEEYLKVKKFLNKNGYKCEPSGSLRRKKSDVGDIDIVVTKVENQDAQENLEKLEEDILEAVFRYDQIEKRINKYEFMLKRGISIHIIPELEKYFNYTLWHSTGPKPHVKLIKEMYTMNNKTIKKEFVEEKEIYREIGLDYIEPEERYSVK
jgi:DNA polymerase/3'-5' exonuclease PolX